MSDLPKIYKEAASLLKGDASQARFADAMLMCVADEPWRRPTAEEILQTQTAAAPGAARVSRAAPASCQPGVPECRGMASPNVASSSTMPDRVLHDASSIRRTASAAVPAANGSRFISLGDDGSVGVATAISASQIAGRRSADSDSPIARNRGGSGCNVHAQRHAVGEDSEAQLSEECAAQVQNLMSRTNASKDIVIRVLRSTGWHAGRAFQELQRCAGSVRVPVAVPSALGASSSPA